MRLYIAVLDQVPDFIAPTLVAHTMLGAHLVMENNPNYKNWLQHSFKKCVIRVSAKEFARIAELPGTYLGHENKTLDGIKSCAIPIPCENEDLPKVLKYARLWKPLETDKKAEDEVR